MKARFATRAHGDHGSRRGGHILLPFTNQAISRRAFDAAIRIAQAEGATLMPAFLARVPRTLPLESPLPAACNVGMPLLEAIEQKASAEGVPVDARVSRGRTYRDALQRLLNGKRFDLIASSTDDPRRELSQEDLAWLLDAVTAEVVILRPAPMMCGASPPADSMATSDSPISSAISVAVSTSPRVRSRVAATTMPSTTLPIPSTYARR